MGGKPPSDDQTPCLFLYTTGRMAKMGTPINTTRIMTMITIITIITIITTTSTHSIGMRLCASVW